MIVSCFPWFVPFVTVALDGTTLLPKSLFTVVLQINMSQFAAVLCSHWCLASETFRCHANKVNYAIAH